MYAIVYVYASCWHSCKYAYISSCDACLVPRSSMILFQKCMYNYSKTLHKKKRNLATKTTGYY